MAASGMMVRVAGLGLLALSLAACANSNRLSGTSIGSRPFGQPAPAQSSPDLQSAPPVATARVDSQALPPPGGAGSAPSSPANGALPPPVDPFFQSPSPAAGTPTTPVPAPRAIETPTLGGGGREVATLGGSGSGGGRGAVASREGVIGGWTAREATGGSCRVTLSSSPALDLYRANAAGCANRDLQKVTAWDYRDGEVFLYQPGGSVAARMRVDNGSSLTGVIARSGASVTMAR